MLKKAKYWKAFTAATRAKAEEEAAAWWAEQSGFDRISGWTLPAAGQPADANPGWTATIIYTPSDPEPRSATVH
jgi:hypothetical protein